MKCNLVYELRAKKVSLLPAATGVECAPCGRQCGKDKERKGDEERPRPRQRFARGEMNLALAARLKQWHVARGGLPRVARCTLLTLQQQLWPRLQTTLAANFLLTLQQLRHQASGMRHEASSLSRSHRKNTRNAVRIRIRIRTPHSHLQTNT